MAISEAIRSASAADGGGRLMRPLSCANAAELNIKAAETTKAFHMAFWHTEADGHLYNKKAASAAAFSKSWPNARSSGPQRRSSKSSCPNIQAGVRLDRRLRNSLGPWPSPSIP